MSKKGSRQSSTAQTPTTGNPTTTTRRTRRVWTPSELEALDREVEDNRHRLDKADREDMPAIREAWRRGGGSQ